MISWMQTHRKYLVVTIWISTIAFVGAGFVGWGAYSFSADKSSAVAQVGDVSITGKELQSSYNNVYNYYNQVLGGKLTQEKANELKLEDIALRQLIKETLLLNYANELGITALESEIFSKIESIDNFKKDAVFDKETYFKVLQAINKEAKDFEAEIKKEIITQKLSNALNMPYTPLELSTLGASVYIQDKISVKLVTAKDSEIDINEKSLKEFWNENQTNYLSEKSYTVELIKVDSKEIEVNEDEMQEFYKQKRHLFKGDDDKILNFTDAKKQLKIKVQLKKAKKEILKKYLAFKNGKVNAQTTKTLTAKNSDIPLDQIATVKVGSFIKAIKLKDGYVTAKLTAINLPQPLSFEDAKDSAKADLFKAQKAKLLQQKAELENKELKDATQLGYLSKEGSEKVTMLDTDEATEFLNHLFSKSDKKGYYIFTDKAIVYEITDQKLDSKELINTNKENLTKSIESLKNNTMQEMLIKRLEKKYKIEYYKG